MGVFVVGRLRLDGGNVATKQYADADAKHRLVLGPKSSGPPIADGVTQGETLWDNTGVSIWTGSLWRLPCESPHSVVPSSTVFPARLKQQPKRQG